jgi:exodeoxyribonuclease VII large subunit
MARLPFNPDRVRRPEAPRPAQRERAAIGADAQRDALTVTQVTLLVKSTLADHTPAPLKVVGEISNFADRNHWYLSLKDEQNVLDCVMWASAARKVRFRPERGTQVVATGRLDYYGPQGRLQLYIDKLQPVGQGELELRFAQLCEELRGLGYFDEDRKRPLPAFPQRIAVVTSAKGAAIQDVIHTTHQRWAGCRLCLVDVPVQGATAAPSIARAVGWLSQRAAKLRLDAIILTRGGGSIEDLWAFNERVVADAVLGCTVPIVAAIGHEVDTTIAELVADRRCATPTQAAAVLVPDAAAERHRLGQSRHRLATALRRRAEIGRDRVAAIGRHPLFAQPDRLVRAAGDRLDDRAARLARAGRQRLARAGDRLDALRRQLESVGPRSVLARGFTYTTRADGRLVRRTADAAHGEELVTHVTDGQIRSVVRRGAGSGRSSKAAARPRRKRPDRPGPGSEGLFGDER